MELRHLRYFVAIADLESISEAGRRLHVSQSTISEQIGDLESEVGGSMFDRRGGRVRLTPQRGDLFGRSAENAARRRARR